VSLSKGLRNLMERVAVNSEILNRKLYSNLKFIPSGSTVFDLALGGGWAQDRVFNIVGDKSTNKTGICIECFANFARVNQNPLMKYSEAEAAFDDSYAQTLGFPPDVIRPKERLDTVEDFHEDLKKFIADCSELKKEGKIIRVARSGLYILDSLDALSCQAEKNDKDSYGAAKAKEMSALFRDIVRELEGARVTLGIVSQIRDNIGVMFGKHYTRSGGHALDFYCTHVVWLAETGKIKRTIRSVERTIGIDVKAKVEKNKVGAPFREASFPVIFNYGIDDEISMIEWLEEAKVIGKVKIDDEGKEKEIDEVKLLKSQVGKAREAKDLTTLTQLRSELISRVTTTWRQIEADLAPPMQKYAMPQPIPKVATTQG
jgi:protein RecA